MTIVEFYSLHPEFTLVRYLLKTGFLSLRQREVVDRDWYETDI